MLKRVLADRRQVEDEQAAAAAAADGEASFPLVPDLGERRLGWFVAAVAIAAVVVVLALTLTGLSGLGRSADPSALPDAPAASWAGDAPAAGASGPAGSTPTGSVAAPAPGGSGSPAAAPGAPGGPQPSAVVSATAGAAAPPGSGATAAPGGTTGPATTAPAGTDGPGATAEPDPTAELPPDVQAALADLSAAIRRQVDAGQLDPTAGYDLQSKVHQVAREVSEGHWATARYYADRIREKLRKYRDDGMLSSTGYQALIARVDVLDDALA